MSVLKKMPMMSELAPARDALERRASYAAIWLKKPQSRRPLGFVVAALVALVLLGTTFSHTVGSSAFTIKSFAPSEASTTSLRLLVPATESNALLCQTLLSAAVLGYPAPVLINWAHGPKFDFFRPYASHIQKVSGIKDYLNKLPAENDDDLVLIIDGFDVWMQLRPEVMIERYYAINQAANERIIRTYGKDQAQKYDMRQTVVWGADKKCFPQKPNAPACYAVPNSTLAADIYGPKTDDKSLSEDITKVTWIARRPRWLNSGTVMGPVKELRPIFEAAYAKYKRHNDGDRDQFYFGELFGEQEWYRLNRTSTDMSDTSLQARITEPILKNENPKDVPSDAQTELHMGLDYENQLFHTNTFSKDDNDWIVYNGTTDIAAMLETHKIDGTFSADLPQDILNSRLPFTMPDSFNTTDKPVITWRDVPLATNLRSRSVPAIVHINGDKVFLFHWWRNMWFQPYAKFLMDKVVQQQEHMQVPVAVYNRESSGHFVKVPDVDGWWKSPNEAASFFTSASQRLGWDRICKAHDAMVLAKGSTPW